MSRRFLDRWVDPGLHPDWAGWLRKVPGDPYKARCAICSTDFRIDTMGATALKSHSKGQGHTKASAAFASQRNVYSMFSQQSSSSSSQQQESSTSIADQDPGPSYISPPSVRRGVLGGVEDFVVKDTVTRAEIRWTAKCIMNHFSYRSCADINELFPLMFPDSEVAKKFSLGRDKVAYYTTFGLAPYFHQQLLEQLLACDVFVVCFDEALNKVSQRGQMDMHFRFWNRECNLVSSRYLTSSFLGRSRATDMCCAFREGMSGLPLAKALQISMDGPNVNWKFYSTIKGEIQVSADSDPGMLELGSCGLHVVNGAFQTGNNKTAWHLNRFFRSSYWLFKDSPARRSEFTRITGSALFPKKFCHVRWLENSAVAARIVQILPHLKKFVNEIEPLPASETFRSVKGFCSDPLIAAKVEFFRSVSLELEPFLRQFQTAKPMAPLLYEAYESILRKLMTRFVQQAVLLQADTGGRLCQVDITSAGGNCLPAKRVAVGFGASRELGKVQVPELTKLHFYNDCRDFIMGVCSKLIERSPLRYPAVRACSFLSPVVIRRNALLSKKRMQKLLEILVAVNRATPDIADQALNQFNAFVENTDVLEQLKKYDRLDSLYSSLLSGDDDKQELWSVVKLVLILSHGNATVESGFSVNNDILVNNLQERSLVAQRMCYDSIHSAGGVLTLDIPKTMLASVVRSRRQYRQHLESQSRQTTEQEEKKRQQKRVAEEIQALQTKKKLLEEESRKEISVVEKQLATLQKSSH